ncbi:MAG: arabinose transporter [Myxococcaceae bacterium]
MKRVLPICAFVFAEFFAMGLPLPVLPMHVSQGLGLGAFIVGLAIGAQSWATLLTRHVAGSSSDQQGPKRAALLGLALSSVAGLIVAASTLVPHVTGSLAVLLAGRALLGFGESLVITSALSWGVSLAGRERSGLVMAWVGIAMYGALAAGAPLGSALEARVGFAGVSLVAAAAPVLGLIAALLATAVAPIGGTRLPFSTVVRQIWWPGAGLTLSALGFGAIAAFATLLFRERGWTHGALAMTAFGGAYVVARLMFGSLPDRFGGARVAVGSTAIAGAGQALMFVAPNEAVAVVAAALTGLGFSLSFPAFGVEAIKRVPPQSRGVALGAYAACFDLTMGVGVPSLGMVVAKLGYASAFAVGAVSAVVALLIALSLVAPLTTPEKAA